VIAQTVPPALEWTPEQEYEQRLRADVAHWFTEHPDRDSDSQEDTTVRAVYNKIDLKLLNPNRETREPFLSYAVIKQAIIFDKVLTEQAYEDDWKSAVLYWLDVLNIRFTERYTKPDPADE
jgi:hypothetical protein